MCHRSAEGKLAVEVALHIYPNLEQFDDILINDLLIEDALLVADRHKVDETPHIRGVIFSH